MTETTALVVGAGPAGLFQVFELGLLGIKAHVVDVLPQIGGQVAELYPDKIIYDIPAQPACTGRELIANLQKQAAVFEPVFHLGQLIDSVQQQPDSRFLVTTRQGASFLTSAIFITAGVGAFMPRSLPLEGLDRTGGVSHDWPGLHSNTGTSHWLVLGGDESAVQAAIDLVQQAQTTGADAHISLIHRRQQLDISDTLQQQLNRLIDQQALKFEIGQVVGYQTRPSSSAETARISSVDLATPQGEVRKLPCDYLHLLLGLSPRLGPIADWGLALLRRQLQVDTASFSTSTKGIFAAGDVVSYPGKRKLILSGFHEATLAAYGAASYLRGGAAVALEYTTASSRLQRLLGAG
jgi:thioredoxin reductase (NADPH)